MSKRIEVKHDWYGCATGCCGTSATQIEGDKERYRQFEFAYMTEGEAQAFGEQSRGNWGLDWANAEIAIGDLRCFEDQINT